MTDEGATSRRSRSAFGSRWPWALTAAALVVAGTTGSWATAASVARGRGVADENRLLDDSDAVVADLEAAIDRHADLAAHAAAWASGYRSITTAQLSRWVTAAHVAQRHPNVAMIGVVPVTGQPVAVDLSVSSAADRATADTETAPGSGCVLVAEGLVDTCALRRLLDVGLPAAEGDAALLEGTSGEVVATSDPFVALTSTPIYDGSVVPTTP